MSTPGFGRSINGSLARWNHILVTAQAELSKTLADSPEAVHRFHETWLRPVRQEQSFQSETWAVAAALLSGWLVARANGRDVSLAKTDEWFTGEAGLSRVVVLDAITGHLDRLPTGPTLDDILPYLMEAFEEHASVGTVGGRFDRAAKRRVGSVYTPEDVAQFVANTTISTLPAGVQPKCLDPACGTGVFLRAALECIHVKFGRAYAEICNESIYGMDISAMAVQSAAFVLLSRCLSQAGCSDTVYSVWAAIRENLACFDTTSVAPGDLTCIFPSSCGEFQVILGNPPYSSLPLDQHQARRASIFGTAHGSEKRRSAFPLFVEMMWRYSSESHSCAGMVLPLSIASNRGSQMRTLRRLLRSVTARWRFLFYDRSPDSLFGDDVKTRNAILFMRRDADMEPGASTSEFLRWTSRERSDLFGPRGEVDLGDAWSTDFIPKFQSSLESETWKVLRGRRQIGSILKVGQVNRGEEQDSSVYFFSTAYNWLPLLRYPPEGRDANGEPWIPNSIRCLTADNSDLAAMTFAVFSSRLAYWLWRVEGDGFHLTSEFLRTLPFNPVNFEDSQVTDLARLGRRLWAEMIQHPIHATNAGITTLNFSPLESSATISDIDSIIVHALQLPSDLRSFLDNYVRQIIRVGRS